MTKIYIRFKDHCSTSNAWETREEFLSQETPMMEAIGFLEEETSDTLKITTMRDYNNPKPDASVGSGHLILKSDVRFYVEMPESLFKDPEG
jgi:hypothetical protein